MKLRLEKRLFSLIIVCIFLILAIFLLIIYRTNHTIGAIFSENRIDTNSFLQNNVNNIYENINLIEKQSNLLLPNIHKFALNNRTMIENSVEEVFYFADYGYRCIFFEYNDIFSVKNPIFRDKILAEELENSFNEIISGDSLSKYLIRGQLLNKIVRFNGENYIFSVKYILTSSGKISGACLILMRLRLFVDLDALISGDVCLLGLNNDRLYSEFKDISLEFGKIDINNLRTNGILENKDIKFAYKLHKSLGVIVISYIKVLSSVSKTALFDNIFVILFFVTVFFVIFLLIYYRQIAKSINKELILANKDLKVEVTPEKIDLKIKEDYFIGISNALIGILFKYKAEKNLYKVKENLFQLKKLTQNIEKELINLREMFALYKNLEMNGNMLEINIAILCNKLNDNSLNDIFIMIKGLNQRLREGNSNIRTNLFFSSEYDKLFTIFEKTNNLLELLISNEKNKINGINSFKNKLERGT